MGWGKSRKAGLEISNGMPIEKSFTFGTCCQTEFQSSIGNSILSLNRRWLYQRLTWLTRWLCHKANDRNGFPATVEGSLAINGVVKNKNSAAVAARRDTKDSGMAAFQAADT